VKDTSKVKQSMTLILTSPEKCSNKIVDNPILISEKQFINK